MSGEGLNTFELIQDEEAILSLAGDILKVKLDRLVSFPHVSYITTYTQRRSYGDSLWVELSTWTFNGVSGAYGVITSQVNVTDPRYEPVPSRFLAVCAKGDKACSVAMKLLPEATRNYVTKYFSLHDEVMYTPETFPYREMLFKFPPWESDSSGETASDDEDKWGPDF